LAAGSVSPKNALSQAPDPVHQNIMAAKSKHSQMHLATITENTELEQPSSSACSYDEANIDNLPRVLPHHGNSLWQRVIDLIHCFGPHKMNVDQVRQNVVNTGCRVVHATNLVKQCLGAPSG